MKKLDRLNPTSLSTNPRASLQSWLRYQPVVEAAFRMHPRPFTWQPTTHSAATVASRLREAVRGLLCFHYDTRIPEADLQRWWSEVVVRHDKEKVWIGPVEKNVAEMNGKEHGTPSSGFSFDSLTFEEVTAFALLLSNGKLLGPVAIKNPPDVTLLEDRNVQVLKRDDGSLILI